jgi:hypothetical protein
MKNKLNVLVAAFIAVAVVACGKPKSTEATTVDSTVTDTVTTTVENDSISAGVLQSDSASVSK